MMVFRVIASVAGSAILGTCQDVVPDPQVVLPTGQAAAVAVPSVFRDAQVALAPVGDPSVQNEFDLGPARHLSLQQLEEGRLPSGDDEQGAHGRRQA